MGYMPQQQQTIIQIAKETKWWIPLAVAGIATIGGIIKAILARKGKEK